MSECYCKQCTAEEHDNEPEQQMNKRKWCVVCDDDGDPVSEIAHMMMLCDGSEKMHDEEYCNHEFEERWPICGQVFHEGWMQVGAIDQRHCKKCTAKLMKEVMDV